MTVAMATAIAQDWHWQGHRIRWTVAGEGQPLILLHGFGASLGHWRKNIPVLAAGGYRVYALDLLGFGASDKPDRDYSLDLWADLVTDFWDAHIQQPTWVIGNSIGALLSLMLLVNQPDRFCGGVLLNCAGGLNHRPEEMIWPLGWVMSSFAKVVNTPKIGPFLFNQVRQRFRIRQTLRQVYGNRKAVTDELVDLIYEPSCDPGAYEVFAAILRSPAGPSPQELLPQLQRPLLVIWGEADPWTPVSAGKIFQKASGQQTIEYLTLPATGHCPHDERPELVNPLILNWLDRQTITNRALAVV
ncbi:alpha/beta fold hydrolase [Synechococcus elongatus IITB4]|uniref:alpha/beta fold hydrolase n=1 Tax=Synechococcus elongatus TaxID=32046 RepID=UPI0030CFFFEC